MREEWEQRYSGHLLPHFNGLNLYMNEHTSIHQAASACTEAVVQRCSVKNAFLEVSQNSQKNTYARVSFLIRFIKKETLAQVFSCEFCEISKTTFFHRTPLEAALN